MAAIIVKSATPNLQPINPIGINYNNPITKKLAFVVNHADYIYEIHKSIKGTVSGTLAVTPTEDYLATKSSDKTSYINFATTPISNLSGGVTIVLVAKSPAEAVISRAIALGQENSGSGYTSTQVMFNAGYSSGVDSGKVAVLSYSSSIQASSASIAGAVDGKWHTWAFLYSQTTGWLIYRDGVNVTGTSQNTTSIATSDGVRLHGAPVSSTQGTSFPIALSALFAQSDIVDAIAIGINPWQIFGPQRSFFFLGGAGGGAVTLAIGDIYHAHLLASLGLTQQNALAAASLAQQQLLSSPGLSQQHTLSTAQMQQPQLVGNVSLSSAGTLSVQAQAQPQVLSAPSLTQQNSLSVQGETQAQTLGTLSLVQQQVMALAGMLQSQSLSAPSLTQQNSLSVQSENQNQALSAPGLSTALTLNVAAATQTQLLNGLSLTQQSVLTVGTLQQSQILGTIGLSQATVLSVSGQLQAQFMSQVNLGFLAVIAPNNLVSQQVLNNIALAQATILAADALSQGQGLSNIALAQNSVLIVSDVLHTQLLSGVLIHDGIVPLTVRGSTVFVYASAGRPVYIIRSKLLTE